MKQVLGTTKIKDDRGGEARQSEEQNEKKKEKEKKMNGQDKRVCFMRRNMRL